MQRYEDAVRQAIEEGQRVAKTKKLRDYLDQAAKALSEEKFDDALREITRALHLDPSDAEALDLEQTVYTVRDETVRRREQAGRRAEQRRRLDELQRRLEEQARADAEVQKERALREAKSAALVHKIKELNRTGRNDAALSELENLYTIDPGNPIGREIEMKIIAEKQSRDKAEAVSAERSAAGESWRQREEGQDLERQVDRDRLKQDAASTYRNMLRQAWGDGVPASDDKAMIEVIRLSLGIDERERATIETEVRNESYAEAFKSAWRNGIVNPADEKTVEPLRNVFGLKPFEAHDIESVIVRKRN